MARFRLASQLPNQNRTFVTAGAPFVCNAWMDTRMICNIWSTKTSSFNALTKHRWCCNPNRNVLKKSGEMGGALNKGVKKS